MYSQSTKYATMRRLLHLTLFLFALPAVGFSADFYWRGTTTFASWSDLANWTSTAPGGGPLLDVSALPGASDRVIFTSLGSGSVSVDVTVTVQKIEVREDAAITGIFSSNEITLNGYTDGLGFEGLATNVIFNTTADFLDLAGFRQLRGTVILSGNTTHTIAGDFVMGPNSTTSVNSFLLAFGNTLVFRANFHLQEPSSFRADPNTYVRFEKPGGASTANTIRVDAPVVPGAISASFYNLIVNTGSAPNDIINFFENTIIEVRNDVQLVAGRVDATPGFAGGIRLYGDLTSFNGSLVEESSAHWYFAGDQPQTIALFGTDVDKLGGPFHIEKDEPTQTVTLLSPLTLIGAGQVVDFTRGRILTDGVNILTFGPTATAINYSADSYVEGPAQKLGNTAFTFPIGDAGVVAPLLISGAAGATTGLAGDATTRYVAQYFRANPTGAGFTSTSVTPALTNASGCEYWTLAKTGGSVVGIARVWLSFESARSCGITDPTQLKVANWPNGGTSWLDRSSASSPIYSDGINTFVGTAAAQTSYPVFTLASFDATLNPLPVNWLNFTGRYFNGSTDLNWETAIEKDNAEFTVERSASGHSFDAIGTVPGRINSDIRSTYNYVDRSPFDGDNYYRIKQTDINGTFTYTKTIRVTTVAAAKAGLNVYPNPVIASQQLTLENPTLKNKKVTVTIMAATGSIVRQEQVTFGADSRIKLRVSNLLKGAYFIRVQDNDKKLVTPFIVQ